MGVPKFYRWLSERYPQINLLLSDRSVLPEIDNLYLDMNGIIHACTHPNDADVSATLTLREMMLAIFRYIDRMVTEIAKPKKILFMAIDGCAPRAKMNQQRSRRFRAAQDRMLLVNKARERGETIDDDNMFDSNCITPGTEFMEQVGKHLRWFIRKKMKEDPLWRDLEVTFSGHDVPGEGEHKIMQYIRELRVRDDYQPNTRHCMYGQDADLIMLGLATHEPHFTLLREVVNFNTGFKGGASARSTVLRQTKEAQFQLLNLAVLREYIEVDLALGCGYAVDKERLVDDFIFLTFLVGNDFLPHLPSLDIGEHAFDLVFSLYKELLEESEGYLVHNGELGDLVRLERLMTMIGKQEAEILANREYEEKKNAAKRRKYKDAVEISEEEAEEAEEARRLEYEAAVQEALGNTPAGESKRDPLDGGLITKDYRGRYYYEKFNVVASTTSGAQYLGTLSERYLEGLMWCLAYYVKGCISWTWYYPYHYGPMLIDMRSLDAMAKRIKFDLGQPFKPFQQLLGCLPPASKKLIPRSYQWLMTSEHSPLISVYPEDFKIDQDGKKNPWEAVVLLPFIDEKLLVDSEREFCKPEQLSRDEIARNTFGHVLVHRFDPSVTETYFSCNPEIGLTDVVKCQTRVVEVEPDYRPGVPFKPELVAGTSPCLAGFPSLGALRISNVTTDSYKINVFGSDSKYRTVAIELECPEYDADSIDLRNLLGRQVYVNYPQLHEARVVAASNEREEFRLVPSKDPLFPNTNDTVHTKFHTLDMNKWKAEAADDEMRYLKGRGLPGTGGLVVGEVKIRLRVQALQGMQRDPVTGANKKVFGTDEADVPIQMALWSPQVVDERFLETDEMPVSTLYPHGSQVMGVSGKFKGCMGVVVGPHSEEESRTRAGKPMTAKERQQPRCIDVEFTIPSPEPPFGYMIEASVKEEYFSSRDIVKALNISPSLLGKIVGSLYIDKIDAGLNLKRSGQYFLLGYVREVVPPGSSNQAWGSAKDSVRVIGSVEEGAAGDAGAATSASSSWEYSAKAVALILEYKQQFPQLFNALEHLPHEKKYSSNQIWGPGSGAKIQLVKLDEWLNAQFTAKAPRTPLSTLSLSRDAIKAVERAADVRTAHLSATPPEKLVVKKVPLEAVYRGDLVSQFDAPLLYNAGTVPRLGDRVRNLNSLGVPFGLRGTVITIHNATGYVEVVFDEEFVGGRALGGHVSQFRGRLCPWHGLLRVSTDEQAAAVGSTGRGTASSTKIAPTFNHGDAVKGATKSQRAAATAGAPTAIASRDGHVMGMHPAPVPHAVKAKAQGDKAPVMPGSVREISLLNKDLIVNRTASLPVTFAPAEAPTASRPARISGASAADVHKKETANAPAGTTSQDPTTGDGRSLLALLQTRLNISAPAGGGGTESADTPTAASASTSSISGLPADAQEVGKVSISLGGFRILRSAAGLPPPAPATSGTVSVPPATVTGVVLKPPAPPAPIEPNAGRAALALAAGLSEHTLPPLPQGPLEPELSGVIQVPTGPRSILNSAGALSGGGGAAAMGAASAGAGAGLQGRGFFSMGGSGVQTGAAAIRQRPPSPLKERAGSPSKRAGETPKAAVAAAPAAAPAAASNAGGGVAEKLAKAKALMLQRRAEKVAAAASASAGAADGAGDKVEAEGVASASADSAAPSPADKTKKMVPANLLLKKLGK